LRRPSRLGCRYDGGKNLNELWLVDSSDGRMREVKAAAPPEPRSRHTMHVMWPSTLHIFGGYDGFKPYAGDVHTIEVEDSAAILDRLCAAAQEGK